MTDYSLVSKIDLVKVSDSFYTANYGNRIFSIGNMLYEMLCLLKKEESIGTIKNKINQQYNVDITESFINNEIEKFTNKLVQTHEKRSSTINYIYFKIKLFGKNLIDWLTSPLLILFHKFLFPVLVSISIIASVFLAYIIYVDGIWTIESSLKHSLIGIVLIYLGFAAIGLFHELGHAASSRFYGKPSEEIGFGFYLIFPVFYTDVTKIWNLGRGKRVVVNLAGIYFQLLINLLFYVLYVLIDNVETKIAIKFFFLSNIILLVYSLNPFLRNDGYWVYSDFFGIPNLMSEAIAFPKKLYIKLKSNISFRQKISFVFNNKALGIYSVLLYIVFVLLITLFIWLTYQNIIKIQEMYSLKDTMDWSSFEVYYKFIHLVVGLTINIYFLTVIVKRLRNSRRTLPI
ncbi:hypothetical protein [Flavobacterium chilense]|uniref:Putative peptide zinc metalloprotease protein n=1 Tax=Flavobacterium chilense TaxID=946677 RepID=A0A1M7MW90_9FLAO|nr:hypothetical protein [Flavobacterium chilense]SHM95294.1 putative peptide zinc metalloprotease protein [Flavobacterium chilense]